MALSRARRAVALVLGLGLLAAGAAILGWAFVQDQAGPVVSYEAEGGTLLLGCSIFGCPDRFDPTAWYVGGAALVVAAAGPFALAARGR